MKQAVKIPPISKCFCGADAVLIDRDFRNMWRVICDNNHILSKECITKNRAVHRWNNRVADKIKEKT